ncbi:MAG: hypothetical protein QM296_00550 [Bacillota bacterium]|nr:hypothetical protein [Bacillota bacterium]
MIEQTIRNHLLTVLDVPVWLEEPNEKPARYVLFEKTGSGRSNRLDSSTFAFQSYAETLYEAARLNDRLKDAVDSLIALTEIARVSLNSDYNFTDTATKRFRYQAVYDIHHY